MRTLRNLAVLLVVCVVAASCQVLNYLWVVPSQVTAGSTFVMQLTGQTDAASGAVGVVVQVPDGFEVLGAGAWAFPNPPAAPILIRDDPALLAAYTAEPGHYLASFSGAAIIVKVPVISVTVKIYVRAPTAPGAHQLKLALAVQVGTGFVPQLGLNSFLLPGGAAVRGVQVIDEPAPAPFTLAIEGLSEIPLRAPTARCDMDGDGRDDLVVREATALHVRRSVPGGWAAPGGVLATGGAGGSVGAVAAGDFDGDGFGDVVWESGQVAFGDGGTAWTLGPLLLHGGLFPAVEVGDVDGDGRPDLIFADGQGVAVFRSRSDRTFTPWSGGLPALSLQGFSGRVYVDDLDGDGRAEIVVAPRVWRSPSSGQWSLVGSLPTTSNLVPIDIDGNGTKELLLHGVGQVYGYSPSGLVAAPSIAPNQLTSGVALDYDRDGRMDLALGVDLLLGSSSSSRLELWHNVGGGQFVAVPLPAAAGFSVLAAVGEVAAADLDGDTFPDLFAVTDRVLAWRNTQTGAAGYGSPCAIAAPPQITALGSVGAGQAITLQLSGATPGAGALVWAGASRRTWFGLPVLPLGLDIVGAPGCQLLAEPIDVVVVVAGAAGIAQLPVALPPLPAACAITVFAQGAVLDPGANALGAVFTGGIALKIQ